MWPWGQPATTNPSFQPPSAFSHQHVHHVTPTAPIHQVTPQGGSAPSAFVGFQPPQFVPSASASTGGGELSHSHAGIGYGIPGMVSLPVPSPWSQEGLSHPTGGDPHSLSAGTADAGNVGNVGVVPGASPVALSYHPRGSHEELSAGLSHLGGPGVSPTSYVAPPPNPLETPSPTLHQPSLQPHSGQPSVVQDLVSPNSAPFAPPPQQQQHSTSPAHHPHSLTPPQHHSHGYASSSPGAVPPQAQHIHSSSPFSVDFLLRGNPPPNVVESLQVASSGQGGLPEGGHDPTYVRSQSGSFIAGSGHNEIGQEIPAGGWS